MKKSFFYFAAVILLLFAVVSCDKKENAVSNGTETPSNPTNTNDPTNPMDPDDPSNWDSSLYVGGFDENGASNAVFTVSRNGNKVKISRGNLQYQASTGIWRFAENQYDRIGMGNCNIAEDYDGWIDLFGWGTSGWNSGATCYQPWSTSTTNTDYWVVNGEYHGSLVGEWAQADWGVYNAIVNGGNRPGMWRTMDMDEWLWLIFRRSASTVAGVSDARYCPAIIDTIHGLIVFPDHYQHPKDVPAPNGINTTPIDYDDNIYTIEHWRLLEEAGCVFLPVTGERKGTTVQEVRVSNTWSSGKSGGTAMYWSVSAYCTNDGYTLAFASGQEVMLGPFYGLYNGRAVRLVKDSE